MTALSDEAVTSLRPIRELWLQGATLDQLLHWANATTSRAVQYAGSSGSLSATVSEHWRCLCVSGRGPDEGWLHLLAIEAENQGVSSLTIEGDAPGCAAPFCVFTHRQPGVTPRTAWFDPMRGLVGDEEAISTLLSEFSGDPIRPDQILLPYLHDTEPLGVITCFESGRALEPASWEPWTEWRPPKPEPEPSNQPPEPATAAERIVSLLAFLVPFLLASLLWWPMQRPNTLEGAFELTPLILMLSGWLGFVPLVGPTGQVLPWWFRVPWFLGAPFAMFALLFSLGAPS